jgi:hypothetical protein
MTTTIYKPRELSKIEATIVKELFVTNRLFPISPKDPSKKIRFFEPASAVPIEQYFSFSLKVGQHKVDLSVELKPETPLMARLNEVGGLEFLPEEFRVALMTFASRKIIDAAAHLFQLPVTTWDATTEQEEGIEKRDLSFELLNVDAACEARGKMKLNVPLLERLLEAAKKIPILKKQSLSGELLQGEIVIGGAAVSPKDWKSVVPGDLILIQEPSALTTGEGRCLIKKSVALPIMLPIAILKPLLSPLKKTVPSTEKPLSPPSDHGTHSDITSSAPSVSPPPATLQKTSEHQCQSQPEDCLSSSLLLEVSFSAGLLSLTMEEVLELLKTRSVKKPLPLLKSLKILIQQQPVGVGELVEISGRYAVVVIQLYPTLLT